MSRSLKIWLTVLGALLIGSVALRKIWPPKTPERLAPVAHEQFYEFTSQLNFAMAGSPDLNRQFMVKGHLTQGWLGAGVDFDLMSLRFKDVVTQGGDEQTRRSLAQLTDVLLYLECAPRQYQYRLVSATDNSELKNFVLSIAKAFYHPYLNADGTLSNIRLEHDALGDYLPVRTATGRKNDVVSLVKTFSAYQNAGAVKFAEPTQVSFSVDLATGMLRDYHEMGHLWIDGPQGMGESRYEMNIQASYHNHASAGSQTATGSGQVSASWDDYQKQRQQIASHARAELKSIQEILHSIDSDSSSKTVYETFTKVKQLVSEAPELLTDIASAAHQLDISQSADKRRLDFLAGVLAQCDVPGAEAVLSELLGSAKTADEKIQYTAALGDIRQPTGSAEQLLKKLYENDLAAEVRSTAILALGSMAGRLSDEGAQDNAALYLATQLKNSKDPSDTATILAALGNQGGNQNRTELMRALADPTPTVRATAVYGLRSYGDGATTQAMIDVLAKEPQPHVISEGLKVVLARLDQPKVAEQVARIALASGKENIQAMVVSSFNDHASLNPAEISRALDLLRQQSTFDSVKQPSPPH